MLRAGFLTLTTDFGMRDHYVGAMKGVVATIAPDVRVVDITHQVPRFDVVAAAFSIAQAYSYFPAGTVHVVVVDPGVGSARRPVAAQADGHLFVAPDNGVLSEVVGAAEAVEARLIHPRHGLPSLSRTFHGRDLFAPVGARLASGLSFHEVGPVLDDLTLFPATRSSSGTGCVLHVDGFGNVVTSFREHELPIGACLSIAGETICLRADSYASVPANLLFLIVGSSGYFEVALNQASAANALGVRAGDSVYLASGTGVLDQSAKDTV